MPPHVSRVDEVSHDERTSRSHRQALLFEVLTRRHVTSAELKRQPARLDMDRNGDDDLPRHVGKRAGSLCEG